MLVTAWFAPPGLANALWILVFGFLGSAMMGTLGLIAGLWAEKFDQLAAFQNFIIMPLTFLSGVFYSVHSLPPLWHVVSRLNPFFYMIDGFRHGFFGVSDVSPWISLAVVGDARFVVRSRDRAGAAAQRLQAAALTHVPVMPARAAGSGSVRLRVLARPARSGRCRAA